jgi:hypothetical protein
VNDRWSDLESAIKRSGIRLRIGPFRKGPSRLDSLHGGPPSRSYSVERGKECSKLVRTAYRKAVSGLGREISRSRSPVYLV